MTKIMFVIFLFDRINCKRDGGEDRRERKQSRNRV